MNASALSGIIVAQAPPRRFRPLYRVTTFGCAEYLAHRGIGEPIGLHFLEVRPRVIFVAEIQRVVAAHFEVPLNDMKSDRRDRGIVRPRQVAMYLARDLTTQSLPAIGRMFGDRDHTTVFHAIKAIERLIREGRSMASDVEALRVRLVGEDAR